MRSPETDNIDIMFGFLSIKCCWYLAVEEVADELPQVSIVWLLLKSK